jgi:hypothetical protein
MKPEYSFKAPWGTWTSVISIVISLFLLGMPAWRLYDHLVNHVPIRTPIILVLMIVGLFIALPFTVRGYRLTEKTLYVKRLLWLTEVPLDNLETITVSPNAMMKSIRTFGNGGLFSITGYYYNKTLGKYRIFATRLKNVVVLRFSDRVIVITPDQPELFKEKIEALRKAVG